MAGTFSTDVTVGQPDAMARANLSIVSADGGTPMDGHLDVAYDQAGGTVALGSSSFATPSTRVEVSGTLGKMLQVRLRSTDLNDLLPALAMAEDNPPSEIPLKLRNGSVTADGSVTGPLTSRISSGRLRSAMERSRGTDSTGSRARSTRHARKSAGRG